MSGLGQDSGGGRGGGFESGCEHHIGTLEYHVISSAQHSQGE
jgi:hypothetical protein